MSEKFEVNTFDSLESPSNLIKCGCSYNEAVDIAEKLWYSDQYFGVEVVSESYFSPDPIKWIRTKSGFNKQLDEKEIELLNGVRNWKVIYYDWKDNVISCQKILGFNKVDANEKADNEAPIDCIDFLLTEYEKPVILEN